MFYLLLSSLYLLHYINQNIVKQQREASFETVRSEESQASQSELNIFQIYIGSESLKKMSIIQTIKPSVSFTLVKLSSTKLKGLLTQRWLLPKLHKGLDLRLILVLYQNLLPRCMRFDCFF